MKDDSPQGCGEGCKEQTDGEAFAEMLEGWQDSGG